MTSHIGSMSIDCTTKIEIEATDEVIRFLTDKVLERKVSKVEYEVQSA